MYNVEIIFFFENLVDTYYDQSLMAQTALRGFHFVLIKSVILFNARNNSALVCS